MAQQITYGLAALHPPYPRGLIVGSGDDAPPVRAETGRVDQALMAHWFADGLAAFHIPNLRGPILKSGGDAPPIRAETNACICGKKVDGFPIGRRHPIL